MNYKILKLHFFRFLVKIEILRNKFDKKVLPSPDFSVSYNIFLFFIQSTVRQSTFIYLVALNRKHSIQNIILYCQYVGLTCQTVVLAMYLCKTMKLAPGYQEKLKNCTIAHCAFSQHTKIQIRRFLTIFSKLCFFTRAFLSQNFDYELPLQRTRDS